MIKKIDLSFVILILVVLLFLKQCNYGKEKVDDVSVITVEKTGEVKKEIIPSVIHDTIWIEKFIEGKPLPVKKKIVVDSTYKLEYESAIKENDTLKAKNLFLESIALDTYSGTLINNKDIKIEGMFLTRGKLLEYNLEYKIKSDTISYTPEVVYRHPRLSFLYGAGLQVPTNNQNNQPLVLKGFIGIQNKKGNIFTVGVDSQKNLTLGFAKTLKLF
jgi:hypothetical protein